MPLLLLIIVAVAVVAWVAWRWSNQLFQVDVADGAVVVRSGDPPAALLETLRSIAARHPAPEASVWAVKTADGVSLRASGLTDGDLQRLRNVYRLSPQAHYRAAPNPVNEENLHRAWSLATILRILFRR